MWGKVLQWVVVGIHRDSFFILTSTGRVQSAARWCCNPAVPGRAKINDQLPRCVGVNQRDDGMCWSTFFPRYQVDKSQEEYGKR